MSVSEQEEIQEVLWVHEKIKNEDHDWLWSIKGSRVCCERIKPGAPVPGECAAVFTTDDEINIEEAFYIAYGVPITHAEWDESVIANKIKFNLNQLLQFDV